MLHKPSAIQQQIQPIFIEHLLGARHCAQPLTSTVPFVAHNIEVDISMSLALQMSKGRPRRSHGLYHGLMTTSDRSKMHTLRSALYQAFRAYFKGTWSAFPHTSLVHLYRGPSTATAWVEGSSFHSSALTTALQSGLGKGEFCREGPEGHIASQKRRGRRAGPPPQQGGTESSREPWATAHPPGGSRCHGTASCRHCSCRRARVS